MFKRNSHCIRYTFVCIDPGNGRLIVLHANKHVLLWRTEELISPRYDRCLACLKLLMLLKTNRACFASAPQKLCRDASTLTPHYAFEIL